MKSTRLFAIGTLSGLAATLLRRVGYFRFRARPRGTVTEGDVWLVLGFGLRVDANGRQNGGSADRFLAKVLLEQYRPYQLAILQFGPYTQLLALDPTAADWAITLPHQLGLHVNTREALILTWQIMEQRQRERLIVLAHPDQSQRAAWMASRLPIKQLIIPVIPGEVPYDSQAQPWWTQGPIRYKLFELLLARPLALIQGWL